MRSDRNVRRNMHDRNARLNRSLAPVDSSPTPIADLLRILIAEVRGLRADLTRTPQRPKRAELLTAIAASVGGHTFTALSLFDHAERDDTLAGALDVAQFRNAKALGRYL